MNSNPDSSLTRLAWLPAVVAMALVPTATRADDAATAAAPASGTSTMTKAAPAYQPFNLGAEAGTTGFGGVAGWRFADHLGLRGGVDYFSYSLNHTFSGIPYSANLRLLTEHAGIDLYPSRNSSFRLTLGAYFNQNRVTGSAVSDGSLTVNGTPVPAGDSVHLEYQQQPVDPYAAIGGNFYFDKKHHFSLGAELGAFYLGNPKVSVTTTPAGAVPPSDLNAYRQQVEHDLKKVPVWPVLNLSLNYSF